MNDTNTLIAEILLTVKQLEAQNKQLIADIEAVKKGTWGTGATWMDLNEAASALQGAGIRGVSHLRELLYRGVFSIQDGEIRNTGTDKKATWQFNIQKCQSAISYFYALPEAQREIRFPKRHAS